MKKICLGLALVWLLGATCAVAKEFGGFFGIQFLFKDEAKRARIFA